MLANPNSQLISTLVQIQFWPSMNELTAYRMYLGVFLVNP